VGEYDAFGRKVGEDSLAETGWHGEDASTPASVEATSPAEAPVVATSESPAEPTSVDLSELGDHAQQFGVRFVRLFVALVTLAVLGVGGYAVSTSIETATDFEMPSLPENLIPDLEELVPDAADLEPPAAPAPPKGLSPRSLIREAAFAQAMRGLRSRGLGRVTNLRVAADRIDVQLLTGNGRLRIVQVTPGPQVRELSVSGPGFGHLRTISFAGIDTAAPERFTRQAARREGVSPTRVDYLVLTGVLDDRTWSLFFKSGVHYQADAAGRIQRRL
jgi:hypothetical protein